MVAMVTRGLLIHPHQGYDHVVVVVLLLKNVKCSVAAQHSLRHINFEIFLNIIKHYNSLTSRKPQSLQ